MSDARWGSETTRREATVLGGFQSRAGQRPPLRTGLSRQNLGRGEAAPVPQHPLPGRLFPPPPASHRVAVPTLQAAAPSGSVPSGDARAAAGTSGSSSSSSKNRGGRTGRSGDEAITEGPGCGGGSSGPGRSRL